LQQIRSITADGDTNMYAGLTTAFDTLKSSGVSNKHKRVFIFSDGLANKGFSDKTTIWRLVAEMKEYGISTSSFGIGESFDSDMMTGIAIHGTGDYTYIQSSEQIPRLVVMALGGVSNLIGTDVRLKLDDSVMRVVSVNGVHRSGEITLPDLRHGESLNVVVEFAPTASLIPEVTFCTVSYVTPAERVTKHVRPIIQMRNDKESVNRAQQLHKLQSMAEKNVKIKQLIEVGDMEQAKSEKENIIKELQQIPLEGRTGEVRIELERSMKALSVMQTESKESAQKQQDYNNYLQSGRGYGSYYNNY